MAASNGNSGCDSGASVGIAQGENPKPLDPHCFHPAMQIGDGVRSIRGGHRHSCESGWVRGQHVLQVLVVVGDGHHHSLVDSGLFHVSEQRLGGCRALWRRQRFEHVSGEPLGDRLEDVEVGIDGRHRSLLRHRRFRAMSAGGRARLDPASPGWRRAEIHSKEGADVLYEVGPAS